MKSARLLLLPCSLLYWLVIRVRNWFFDIGIFKITKAGVPVISVGNISAGGVGKTPIVEILIEKLSGGKQIAVISRGYGRISKGTVVVSDGKKILASVKVAGDEPSQLAKKYPDVIVIADEQRVRGAEKAVLLDAKMILLDDGFQHRYLHRDVNIVVMTAEEIINGDWLLPAGNRRETMNSVKRSDLIIISRCAGKTDFAQAEQILEPFNKPVLGVQTKLKSFKQIFTNEKMEKRNLSGKKIIALSGIGNPKSFENLLAGENLNIIRHLEFPDHHWFTQDEIEKINDVKKQLKAEFIVTTEKDAVRLTERFGNLLDSENVIVAEIRQEIIDGKETLDAMIKQAESLCA